MTSAEAHAACRSGQQQTQLQGKKWLLSFDIFELQTAGRLCSPLLDFPSVARTGFT